MLGAAESTFAASALYQALARAVAGDERILALACRARRYPPYQLFAAVHYLVLGGGAGPLADIYTAASGGASVPDAAFPAFRDFVLRREDEIARLIDRQSVNKTDLRRGACLRALIVEAAARLGADAVHLVDLGCGAGLNLLLDRWRFDYRNGGGAGPADAAVRVVVDVRGAPPPPGPMPRLLTRTGIDPVAIDAGNPDDERWLVAHLFPEDGALMAATRQALGELRRAPPDIRHGDAAELLPGIVAGLAADVPLVVMHSLAIAFFPPQDRVALAAALRGLAGSRRSARVGMEKIGRDAVLTLALPAAGRDRRAGAADIDGRWMQWGPPPAP